MMFTLTFDNLASGEGAWEIDEWRAAEFSCLPPEGAVLRLWLGELELEPFLKPGEVVWRWRLPAQGSIGNVTVLVRAEWPDGHLEELRASLRVRPRKLDQDRYRALLDDMQRLGSALVFALGGGVEPGGWLSAIADSPPSPAEDLAGLLGPDFERFLAAAGRIAHRPPDRLRPGVTLVDPGQSRDLSALDRARIDPSASREDQGDAAALARRLAAIPERQPVASYDSYENRLFKRTLALLARRVKQLQAVSGLPESALQRASIASGQLRSLRALPLFADVSALSQFAGPTARLQRDPDYRAIYRIWQQLRRRPHIQWDAATLAIPIQDLSRLYERWCAARVALALLDVPGLRLESQAITQQDAEDDMDWSLHLADGGTLLTFDSLAGVRLTLRYQARYTPGGAGLRSLDRHTRVPDLALEISQPHTVPRVLVLDAKYRLDASGGVPEDALADAYSYLGSIGTANGVRAVVAVALLFPGRGPAEVYASGVAALPLLPGDDGQLASWLAQTIPELSGS